MINMSELPTALQKVQVWASKSVRMYRRGEVWNETQAYV